MFQFTFKTQIRSNLESAALRFDQDLLMALKPPIVKMIPLIYEGQTRGCRISFEVGLGRKMQRWDGQIDAHRYTKSDWIFRDIGIKLPFPLKHWEHIHALKPNGPNHTWVIDRVKFQGINTFFTLALALPIIAMFWLRKPGYKKHLQNTIATV